MKKKILFGFIALITVITLAGCGSKNKDKGLVGSWEYKDASGYVYTFNEDKTGSYTAFGTEMKFTYEDKGTEVSILYDGNTMESTFEYKIEGNQLTIKDSFGNDVIYVRK